MTGALLRKELRQLLPFAALVFCVMGIDLLYAPVSIRLDEHTWAGSDPNEGGSADALVFAILATIGAFSLFPREQEEGTLDLLASLPIRRRSVFLAKFTAAGGILLGGLLFAYLVAALMQRANPQTFQRDQLRFALAAPMFLVQASFCAIVLSHGVLLSTMRRLGLVLGGLIAWAFSVMQERSPALAYLNPTHLLKHEFHGVSLVVPWRALALHLGLAGATVLLSYVLWMVPTDSFAALRQRLSTRLWPRVALGVMTFAVVGLGMHQLVKDADPERRPAVAYQSWTPARFETVHYRFTYPGEAREVAIRLMRGADTAFVRVRAALGAKDIPPIVADLTDRSTEHLGLGGWQKIRMDIRGGLRDEIYQHALYHETTHVFAASESDQRLMDHPPSGDFFSEGLAEFVSYQLLRDEERREDLRLLAAVSWQRHKVKFEDLVDSQHFGQRLSHGLLYSLGEVWVEALAQVCGEAAPGDVLRAMRRSEAPRGLVGRVLWQDSLQAIGCEVEAVNTAWQDLLRGALSRRAEVVAHIPQLSGGVLRTEASQIVLAAYRDTAPGWADVGYLLRVRQRGDTPEQDVQRYVGQARAEGSRGVIEYRVPLSSLSGAQFEFQFGFVFTPESGEYYERWQSAGR